MNDILFGNNNKTIIRKITWRAISSDKKRNFFVIVAIMLTTILLAVAFNIGISTLEAMEQQQIRMAGSIAHAYISNPTNDQLETLQKLDYIDKVGTGIGVGRVKDRQSVGNIDLSLVYTDTTQWEDINTPAFSEITGNYPVAENEIMLSRWTLEHLGIENPQLGMNITLSYTAWTLPFSTERTDIFILSGYFTNYYYVNSGGADFALVSKALSNKYGCTSEEHGTANILFKNNNDGSHDRLYTDITLNNGQDIVVVRTNINSDSYISTFAVLILLSMIFMLGGYLLIYNTMLISLSRDIHYYAQLKTVGMTPRQIRYIVVHTVMFLCCVGVPIGLVISTLFSYMIVPSIISANGILTGGAMSYSPLIYVGAAFFAVTTALIAAFTPARKAANVSPVEGSKYTENIAKTIRFKALDRISKPVNMAFRNIFRGGKRCVVVIASMSLSMIILIVTATFTSSIDADKYAESTLDCDIRLENVHSAFGEVTDVFKDDLLATIDALPYLEQKQIITEAMCEANYDGKKFYDQDVCISLYGVDKTTILMLNETLDLGIDAEAFDNGEFAIMEAYLPEQWLNVKRVGGTLVSVSEQGNTFDLPLGLVIPSGSTIGTKSEIQLFVSNNYLNGITGSLEIKRIDLNFANNHDVEAHRLLHQIVRTDNNISLLSQYEIKQSITESITILSVLGGSVSLVFAVIGLLNYINVMAVGVISRRRELAILECVGMERRQIRKMLLLEGIGYGAISLIFGNLLGNTIVSVLFTQLFEEMVYMNFNYPFVLFIMLYMLILLLCVITPLIAYNSINKATVSERLRQKE
ncbi:MAG: ABC transporter permease [Oscillospiraceae bacterium]|nr:ABC transporter permease [Oscillospiraceae bacterium]